MQILSKLTSFYFSWSKIRCPKTFLFRFGFYQSLEKTASNWSKNAKFRRNILQSNICGRASLRWDTSYLIKSSSQRMRTREAAEREFFWAPKIGTDSEFIGTLYIILYFDLFFDDWMSMNLDERFGRVLQRASHSIVWLQWCQRTPTSQIPSQIPSIGCYFSGSCSNLYFLLSASSHRT